MALPDFSGELGGLLATMYITGAISGFGFAGVTIVKSAKEKASALEKLVDELKRDYRGEIEKLGDDHENRIRQLRDFITAQELRCDKRIAELESRVKEVEDSRFELAANQIQPPS